MSNLRTALLIAMALATPTSLAAWSASGSFEPDTPQDISSGMMFVNTDVDPDAGVKQVYMNAFPAWRDFQVVDVNPNVGALGSRILPGPEMGMTGWMGVWKDCNGDSYLGHAETALLHYRTELLTDDTTCPDGGMFNSDGWVTEFWSIGPQTYNASNSFPRVIYDPEARMWGDFGRPEFADEVHFDCAQAPLQAGSTDSSTGLLLYFDCQLGYNVARVITENDPTGGQMAFDGPGGHFHPERDCDNLLYVHFDTYGNDYCDPDNTGMIDSNTSRPAATAWDCDSYEGEQTKVEDPTGAIPAEVDLVLVTIILKDEEDGSLLTVNHPPNAAPAVRDGLDGSVYDAYNSAADTDCSGNYSNNGPGETLLSASFAGTNPTDGKQMADFNMSYGSFGSGVGGVDPADLESPEDGIFLPDGVPRQVPTNLGVNLPGGNYGSSVTYLPPTYLGPTVKNSDFSPAGGIWFTFYGVIGQASFEQGVSIPGGVGVYGTEACGNDFSGGIRGGWDCDPSHWWASYDIGRAGPQEEDPTPGDTYNLRDTDCYDGTIVNGVPVYASLASASSDGPCPSV